MGVDDEAKGPSSPRIAILGIHLESNRFAPPAVREDFLAECWEEGEAITRLARQVSHLPLEVPGFYARMDATGPWTPVPIIMLAAQPSGPVEQGVFDEFMQRAEQGLRAALPLDAVYVSSHGGSCATDDEDNDGTLVCMVREVVGPSTPVVVTHDLHCSVSERLVDATDALIAYRTNPHVDHRERAAEAADLLRRMMGGLRTRKAFIRLPISAPGVTFLTAEGPYADLIALGQRLTKPPVINVSVTAGLVLTDVPKCGMTVNVTTDDDQEAADRTARILAEAAWADRHRYVRELTSVERAVALARDAAEGKTRPVLLADVADNPGGGAPATTTWLMRALHEAGVKGVVYGVFTSGQLAQQAHRAGEGARFHAIFNEVETEFSKRFESPATVLKLSDGIAVGRRGRDAGRQLKLGPSALLELDGSGMRVVVTTLREQLADPQMLEMFGIDIGKASCVVAKSRGHFRAGYDEFFGPEQIYEIDAPGLTSNVLTRFKFKGLKRPSWPLDPETTWDPDQARTVAA